MLATVETNTGSLDNVKEFGFGKVAPVLQLVDIGKIYSGHDTAAVRDVSLDVHSGEIVSILGPSGCGKTTTMRIIAGLEQASTGDVRIKGRSVRALPAYKRNIGMVFQSLAIFPHMSVRRNVAFGLRMKRVPKTEIDGRIERALEMVQLPAAQFAERMPRQLSGGQLQRVALARTLVTEPSLILFDEPMAALDRRLRDHMATELRSIQKDLDIAAIYVTHDQETASVMSDRIAIMDAGRIVQVGAPTEIYRQPASRFVAEFLGDLNHLRAKSGGTAMDDRFATMNLGGGTLRTLAPLGPRGAEIEVFLRHEHVRLSSDRGAGDAIAGEIVETSFASGAFRWRVRLTDGQEIVARSSSNPDGLETSVQVWVRADPADVLVFES